MSYVDGKCDECGKLAVFITAMYCLCSDCSDFDYRKDPCNYPENIR